MLYGACYYIFNSKKNNQLGNKIWDMSYFGFLMGNVMMTFMWHHSLPNLVRPVRPEKSINKMIFYAYILALSVMVIITFSAVWAFGGLKNSCDAAYPCEI